MPRNVRNFWIEGEIDGRGHVKVGGPKAATGGFRLTILQRDRGCVAAACVIRGWASGGTLRLDIEPATGPDALPMVAFVDGGARVQSERDEPKRSKVESPTAAELVREAITRDHSGDLEVYKCRSCKRPEDVCSANPCPDVWKDRVS